MLKPASPSLTINASRLFAQWLASQKVSVAFSTYQIGKLFLIGVQPNSELSIFERTFERCMGLSASRQSLYMATLYQIWRMENSLQPGQNYQGYDGVYIPQHCWVTGNIDVHDLHPLADGSLVFVNTLFSCLAAPSLTHSFRVVWKPPFISKLAAEDRCHLNGLAVKDGRPAYVTAVATTDIHEGWREHRAKGGVVIDVASNDIIASGLSMPHSPRWHDGKLWLHQSGTGEFGFIDMASGMFQPVCFCPGYLRGLAFHGQYAIAGLSKPRHNKTFTGLALDAKLAEKQASARCGLYVINLQTGDIEHSLTMEGIAEEIYDVVAIEGVSRPMAIGFKTDEIQQMISVET